jgi:hypothetical protein
MKKTLLAIMICITSLPSVTAALAIQPSHAFSSLDNGLHSDTAHAPGGSYATTTAYEQFTQLSRKNMTSAYVGADAANNTSDIKLNQSSAANPDLLDRSAESTLDSKLPLMLPVRQLNGSAALSGQQINLRGVYAAEPVSVAIVCAGLIALPFARRFRIMLQKA